MSFCVCDSTAECDVLFVVGSLSSRLRLFAEASAVGSGATAGGVRPPFAVEAIVYGRFGGECNERL